MQVVYHHLMAEEAIVLVFNLLVQGYNQPHLYGLNGQHRFSSMNSLQTLNSKGMKTLITGIQRILI